MKGDKIIRRGDTSPGLYLIVDGTVGLYHYQHPNITLMKLYGGGMFGGTWLIDELEHYDIV
jgi:CRP-like cAMP-binding protein